MSVHPSSVRTAASGLPFTAGHFHFSWQAEPFPKMVLNALLWTAGAEVPEGGVESETPREE